jgi:hypothetical protein
MAGYSGTPLAVKLGIKPGMKLYIAGGPDNYLELIDPLPENVRIADRISKQIDLVHIFATSRNELSRRLAEYRAKLDPQAAVWVSWPKKAAKVATDVTEDVIRELAVPLGFVDIKVCAVTEVWSGLKLVVRRELR